jgi:hypothetical protein
MNEINRKRIMDVARLWPPSGQAGSYSPGDRHDLNIYAAVIESASLRQNTIMLKVIDKDQIFTTSILLKDSRFNEAIERILPKAKGMRVPEFGMLEIEE